MAPSPDSIQPDTAVLQNRLRLAQQARRAKERQLEDIRHALMDVGVIEEGDPYSHADLADVIRQLDSELNPELATCHAQECPCPSGCGCCPVSAASVEHANAYAFVPPAAKNLPKKALDSATSGANMLDGHALSRDGRNFLAHALVQLQRDGWLRDEPNVTQPLPEDDETSATSTPEPAPLSDDHPCAHCTHPKAAHIVDPVWCRNCPPDTSYTGDPGWHEYEPAEEQR